MAKTKYTHRKVSATAKDSKPDKKAVKKLPKESGRSTSKRKPPDKKPKAGKGRATPPALDQDDGANMDDPDKIFSDAEDRALDSLELTVWSDKMIAHAVRAILEKDRKSTLLNIAKEFTTWIKKFIGKPSRPNAYSRWSATINRTMDAFDERKVSAAAKFVNKWAKDQAKAVKTPTFNLSLNKGLSSLVAPLWMPSRVPRIRRNRLLNRFETPSERLVPR